MKKNKSSLSLYLQYQSMIRYQMKPLYMYVCMLHIYSLTVTSVVVAFYCATNIRMLEFVCVKQIDTMRPPRPQTYLRALHYSRRTSN